MKTPPTTVGGARSVIEWLVEWDRDGAMETGQYLATLLRSRAVGRLNGSLEQIERVGFRAARLR
jgi:hypothetical protein